MAINYNLSKVYALSEDDSEFVNDILALFVSEVPADLAQIKEGITNILFSCVYILYITLRTHGTRHQSSHCV